MPINFKNIISLLGLIFTIMINAQNTYKGQIENWKNPQAEIVLPLSDPVIIGRVSEEGTVDIELKDELANNIKASLEQNKGNIRITSTTVNKTFYCNSDDVKNENADINIQKLATRASFYIADVKAKKLYGKFRIVSSQAFSESYFALGKKAFVKGYYINFFYVNEDASVNGICKTTSYTIDMENTVELITVYDINLKKGWNMLKTEVAETYKDGEKLRPLKTIISTINHIPENAKFIFTTQQKN